MMSLGGLTNSYTHIKFLMKKYNFDFNYLAKRFDELIVVKDEKSISYSEIFLMRELESVLETAFDFNHQTPSSAFSWIISDAIQNFVRKKTKDGRALKASLQQSETKYLTKNNKKYHILTSLSFRHFNELPKLNLNGVVISFIDHLPKKYNIFSNISIKYNFPEYPLKNYTIVKIELEARTSTEAIDLGLGKLNLIRGFWNYSVNRRLGSRIQSGKRDSINTIRLGPLHTLHNEDGSLVDNHYWFEDNYKAESANNSIRDKWEYISNEFSHFQKCFKNSIADIDLDSFVIFYSNALDTNDYNSAYLKLWTMLEQLTATGNTSYDKTISRTLFFYKDDKFNKEVLEHLRIVRNKMIHFGEIRDDIEPQLFQLKRIVERVFLFHINNLNYFKNIQEIGQYLDINWKEDSLKREIQFRNRLLKELYRKKRV